MGAIKRNGIGRERGSHTIEEFTELKQLSFNLDG